MTFCTNRHNLRRKHPHRTRTRTPDKRNSFLCAICPIKGSFTESNDTCELLSTSTEGQVKHSAQWFNWYDDCFCTWRNRWRKTEKRLIFHKRARKLFNMRGLGFPSPEHPPSSYIIRNFRGLLHYANLRSITKYWGQSSKRLPYSIGADPNPKDFRFDHGPLEELQINNAWFIWKDPI